MRVLLMCPTRGLANQAQEDPAWVRDPPATLCFRIPFLLSIEARSLVLESQHDRLVLDSVDLTAGIAPAGDLFDRLHR